MIRELVIAGNVRQYHDYLRMAHLAPSEAKLIRQPEDLMGYRGIKIMRVGTYWDNPMNRHEQTLIYEATQ